MKTLKAMTMTLALAAAALAQGGPTGPRDGQCCLTTTVEPATAEEKQWLTFMREEEKLARDVYQQLNEKWNLRVFANIARSEDRHFESIGVLLTRYGVTDPADKMAPGAFNDPTLKALYYKLLEKGLTSVKDALEVGVIIEKRDIEDLEKAMGATTKTDIKTVYTNLLAGSLSHQDAFEQTLEVVAQ